MAAPFNWHWTQWIMEWWCGLPYPPPVVGLLHFMSKPFRLFYAYESATPCVPSHPSLLASSPRLDRGFFFLYLPSSPLLCTKGSTVFFSLVLVSRMDEFRAPFHLFRKNRSRLGKRDDSERILESTYDFIATIY